MEYGFPVSTLPSSLARYPGTKIQTKSVIDLPRLGDPKATIFVRKGMRRTLGISTLDQKDGTVPRAALIPGTHPWTSWY
eukprot:619082-Rhodomonas_salina.1